MFAILLFVIYIAVCVATFAGNYSDPNHPDCARRIAFETTSSARVFGADAAGGEAVSCDGETDLPWGPLPATVNGAQIVVDFSSKGGPSNLTGKYDEVQDKINWQDGNAWTKIL